MSPKPILHPAANPAVCTWAAGGSSLAFPETVSGTTTSGGIPFFSSTTTLTSSALLAANHVLLGGGAGAAPTSDTNLDDGATTASTLTYAGSGGFAANAGPISAGSGPPSCSGGTAGVFCANEGTDTTAASSVDQLVGDATYHDFAVLANGGTRKLLGSTIGYNSGSISASVGATNVASASDFPTGQYLLSCDVVVTAVGSAPTLATTIGWTDISGTARTKTCTTGVVTVSDNTITQGITSNGSAAITVTQTLAVSTATWRTMVGLLRLQ